MRVGLWLCWLWCVGLAAGAAAQAQTAVAGVVRLEAAGEQVTVRLALSQPLAAAPRALALGDPIRWAVDLDGASAERREAAGAGPARGVRVAQFDPATVRLVVTFDRPMLLASAVQRADRVLELRFRPAEAGAFRAAMRSGRQRLADFAQEAPRAVAPGPADRAREGERMAAESARKLDAVERALADAEAAMGPPPAVPETPGRPAVATADALPQGRRQRASRAVVVLDAGHGGRDPGAISVIGGEEKTVTLAIARAARTAIERRARERGLAIDVRLTRDDDRFVTLGNRVRMARDWGADLFVSIHADAAPNAEARGATVYTLSDVASDREAARLAARENRADLIAGVDLSGERADVASILIDLGMRDSMNASADFAHGLQRGMAARGVPFRQSFHRFAGFQVLRNLGVPAVLLEAGYMSNAQDSRWLFSREGQQAVADGLADAVIEWFARGEPPGQAPAPVRARRAAR